MPKLVLKHGRAGAQEMALVRAHHHQAQPGQRHQIDNLAISARALASDHLHHQRPAFLEDQNSTNGTYLSGQRSEERAAQQRRHQAQKYRIKLHRGRCQAGLWHPSDDRDRGLQDLRDAARHDRDGASAGRRRRRATRRSSPPPRSGRHRRGRHRHLRGGRRAGVIQVLQWRQRRA